MSNNSTDELLQLRGKRVWVTGHNGLVGSALVRRLEQEKCTVLVADRSTVDLTSQAGTREGSSPGSRPPSSPHGIAGSI